MRRLTLIIGLISFALATPSVNDAAARRVCDCPIVSVSCPDILNSSRRLTFTATITNFDANSKLTYTWAVSSGTIVSGQGTNSIVVEKPSSPGTLTATLDVGGLAGACPASASCTILEEGPIRSRQIGEYGSILGDEKARLNNFFIELQNDPTAQGYVIAYGGRRGHAGEARRRAERAWDYLHRTRGIEASRIVTVDGGYKEKLNVELWITPSGAIPPSPSPTVEPGEVRIIKGKPKGRTSRR